jgi:hypothetical protein
VLGIYVEVFFVGVVVIGNICLGFEFEILFVFGVVYGYDVLIGALVRVVVFSWFCVVDVCSILVVGVGIL